MCNPFTSLHTVFDSTRTLEVKISKWTILNPIFSMRWILMPIFSLYNQRGPTFFRALARNDESIWQTGIEHKLLSAMDKIPLTPLSAVVRWKRRLSHLLIRQRRRSAFLSFCQRRIKFIFCSWERILEWPLIQCRPCSRHSNSGINPTERLNYKNILKEASPAPNSQVMNPINPADKLSSISILELSFLIQFQGQVRSNSLGKFHCRAERLLLTG